MTARLEPLANPRTAVVSRAGEALVRDAASGRWLAFDHPVEVIEARTLAEVCPAIEAVDRAVAAGAFAAGFVAYDAAPAFDPALVAHHGRTTPLLWFGLYGTPREVPGPPGANGFATGERRPTVSPGNYEAAVARVKAYLAAGDTYQVNYTMRLEAPFEGDPRALFEQLVAAQEGEYAAYVDTGDFAVCSASPELFFRLEGDRLVTKPMKGTGPRGLALAEDRARGESLRTSTKDRAENVMIVDMLRNDIGRIAEPGSVCVERLFDVERYPTVWQMTSTVTGRTGASLVGIFRALFPCASITGAPKARTTGIIAELEPDPRGVYSGAIGFAGPGRRAQFAVAIRTVVVDRTRGAASFGTGGAIVWDSEPAGEHAEALLKARVLTERRPPFAILESLRWEAATGFALLDRHLLRMRDSAEYFGHPFDEAAALVALEAAVPDGTPSPAKVRLLLHRDGSFAAAAEPIAPPHAPVTLALATDPVASSDPFLYHKTTHRAVHDAARAGIHGIDDVLLWNERGEVTETTTSNVAVLLDGEWTTPPVESGLLAGTCRGALIEEGRLHERTIGVADLDRAEAIAVLNSVRGWQAAQLVEGEG